MPVTKTAKRALRVAKRKAKANAGQRRKLEIALRAAQKSNKEADVRTASSLTDRAVKNNLIHKNKAAHIKSSLAKLLK